MPIAEVNEFYRFLSRLKEKESQNHNKMMQSAAKFFRDLFNAYFGGKN